MDNQQLKNRIEAELDKWRSREEKFAKLFSFGMSSNQALQKEKLKDYERIIAKYQSVRNLDELSALRMLRSEKKHLERTLYPNLFVRLFRKLLIVPYLNNVALKIESDLTEKANQLLLEQLKKGGFEDQVSVIRKGMASGSDSIVALQSKYVNQSECLERSIYIGKNTAGGYELQGIASKLEDTEKKRETREHFQKVASESLLFSCAEMYNLLSGRAVQIGDKWVQYDLNDKNAEGSYRLKEFTAEFGYDLENVIKSLPINEVMNNVQMANVIEALQKGDRIVITAGLKTEEKQYHIEANPQFKTVNLYSRDMVKLNHSALHKRNQVKPLLASSDEGSKNENTKTRLRNVQ